MHNVRDLQQDVQCADGLSDELKTVPSAAK